MLKYTLLANYAAQFVTVALGIVTVPLYVKYLGIEAYGLIAFNAVLLAWVQVLDLGLSPTLCRETAHLRSGAVSKPEVALLLVSLEKFVLGVSCFLLFLALIGSHLFANGWFKHGSISAHDVQIALLLMTGSVCARWLCALFKGGVIGLDRQIALNVITVTFAVLRSLLVVPIIAWFPDIEIFLVYQLIVVISEALALRIFLGHHIGARILSRDFSLSALASRGRLSLSIALSSLVWASITQIDKLILSRMLPLAAFGMFSMATLLAGGILLLAQPIQQAVIPRFTAHSSNSDYLELRAVYVFATEVMTIAVMPIATALVFAPASVFRVWSYSAPSDATSCFVLGAYAVGNACAAITSLSYLAQYAKGDLSLHVKGNVAFLAVLVPAIFAGAIHSGARGASIVWLSINLIFLVGWVAIIHRRFLPGINAAWYSALGVRTILVGSLGWLLSRSDLSGLSRPALFVALVGYWAILTAVAIAASPMVRQKTRALVVQFVVHSGA